MKPFLVHTIRQIEDDDLSIPEGSGIWVDRSLKRCYKGTWSFMCMTYQVTVPKNACRRHSAPVGTAKGMKALVARDGGRLVLAAENAAATPQCRVARSTTKHLDGTYSWSAIVFAGPRPSNPLFWTIEWAVCRIEPPVGQREVSHHPTQRAAKAAMQKALAAIGLDKATAP